MKYPYGKVILITGATSGIGYACARLFAQKGFTVWAASRRAGAQPEKFEGGGIIYFQAMDVCDEASVAFAVNHIIEQSGEIGTVLHCAGIGIAAAAEDALAKEVSLQFETNYFGTLRVNRFVLPYMRKRGAGLVLVTGSIAGLIAIPFQSHYSSSKYALEAYVEALRLESKPFGIKACLVEPGDTKTGFTGSRWLAMPAGSPYRDTCESSVNKMARDEQNGRSPESVAKVAVRLSQKTRLPVRRCVGIEYKLIAFARRLLPDFLREMIVRMLYVPRK